MPTRFPPHWMETPHFHSQDRYIIVVQGNWMVGAGPVFHLARGNPLNPGA